jgi:hypothetical protein
LKNGLTSFVFQAMDGGKFLSRHGGPVPPASHRAAPPFRSPSTRGRRLDGSALVLTFAQEQPHDQLAFAAPTEYLAQRLAVPGVFLDRERVVFRHAAAVLLAGFFGETEAEGPLGAYGQVGRFFGLRRVRSEDGAEATFSVVAEALLTLGTPAARRTRRTTSAKLFRWYLDAVAGASGEEAWLAGVAVEPVRDALCRLLRGTGPWSDADDGAQALERLLDWARTTFDAIDDETQRRERILVAEIEAAAGGRARPTTGRGCACSATSTWR